MSTGALSAVAQQVAYFLSAGGAPALVATTAMPQLGPFCLCHLNCVRAAVGRKPNVSSGDLPARLSRKMLKLKEVVLRVQLGDTDAHPAAWLGVNILSKRDSSVSQGPAAV